MGSIKEAALNSQEFNRDKRLAEILGIAYAELEQTNWELDEDEDNEGNVMNLLVRFSEDSPPHILEKIENLDESYTVWLNPYVLNDDEGEDEGEVSDENDSNNENDMV